MTKEEALEIIKRNCTEGSQLREACAMAIPELAESEDEKFGGYILRVCKECVRANDNGLELSMSTTKRLLSYLEKQIGQKPLLNFDAISSWLRDHARRYVNSEFNEFHHCVEYDGTIDVERLIADLKVAVDGVALFDVDAAFDAREPRDNWEYIKEFCDKFGRIPKDIDELDVLVSYVMGKKQKEQKPDVEIYPIEDCDYGLEIALSILEKTLGKVQGYQTDDGIREHQTAIKAVKDVMKEQKPAEWSEDIIQKAVKEVGLTQHQIDWFKANVFPPKQEWSEEDEKIRQSIIKDIEWERNFTSATTGKVIGKYNEQINWLKSLPLNLKKKNEDVAKLCSNEWSEEDEEALRELLNILSRRELEVADDSEWLSFKLKSWVKLLHSYPKQEWSEEDERKLQKCIKIVERWEEDYDIAYTPYSSILKSLRPSWKPDGSIENIE